MKTVKKQNKTKQKLGPIIIYMGLTTSENEEK